MRMQYTIRSFPDLLDRAVRQRVGSKGISAEMIEALAEGMDVPTQQAEHSDLDHLIGTWQENREFDRVVVEFGRVEKDGWT